VDQYLDELGRQILITPAEENALARRAREGDVEAENQLVSANLRFVVSVAKRYQHRGMSLDDLIGEGNVGLIAAAHRFDPDQGVRFVTYAVWWIRQAILIGLMKQGRIVRVPASRLARHARLSRARKHLRSELGREPTTAEIAGEAGTTAGAVAEWLGFQTVQISLDAPLSNTSDRTISDQLACDAPGETPEENEDVARVLRSALNSLQPREATILRSYFGLEGNPERTLDQIATDMHITRERVRQIRDRAIGKMRYGKFATALSTLAR
jgi:RNA polymerase primary sigma factor